jgi:hypothetical protein
LANAYTETASSGPRADISVSAVLAALACTGAMLSAAESATPIAAVPILCPTSAEYHGRADA